MADESIPDQQVNTLESFFPKPKSVDVLMPIISQQAGVGSFFGQTPKEREEEIKRQELSYALFKTYVDVLDEYSAKEDSRFKFWNNDPNVGFKCHLNAKPVQVIEISEFLKAGGYNHKFLSGGEVEDGKIFTVYLGGKSQAEDIVRQISNGVGGLLVEPKPSVLKYESLFAPNISGRFGSRIDEFDNKYFAIDGVPIRKTMWRREMHDGKMKTIYSPGALDDARNGLSQHYGDYFGGGLDFYNPAVQPAKSELEQYFEK